jgi:endogenous inhibitor of DNA gyrase (YacG/DUF329 family)
MQGFRTTKIVVECPICFTREYHDIKENLLYAGGCKSCDQISYGIWRTDKQCLHCGEAAIDGTFPIEVYKINRVKCIRCKHK